MTADGSYTVWDRLEPDSRDPELTGTLRGELADPLWLLSRQRQFGEFSGENAGSPVDVRVDYEHDYVTHVEVGDTTHRYEGETPPPVESLVEREPVAAGGGAADGPEPTYERRVEAGMNFLDRLRRELSPPVGDQAWRIEHFAEKFRLAEPGVVDAEGRRYADIFDGEGSDEARRARALDGHAIYEGLIGSDTERPARTVDWSRFGRPVEWFLIDDLSGWPFNDFKPIAKAFVTWYANCFDEPGTAENAWNPDRLEYEASVSAGSAANETVFRAEEYQGGRMDWYDFAAEAGTLRDGGSNGNDNGGAGDDGDGEDSQSSGADDGQSSDDQPDGESAAGARPATEDPPVLNQLPTAASFRGMPASRFWEVEDADVDLASVSAAADDLSRLLVLEFALIAGDDWFTLPIEAPVGSVTRITDLTVTDSFGVETTDVPATVQETNDDWGLFTFDLPGHEEPGLFVPPVRGTSLSGEAVEDVLFARDEVANLVFGVEEVVEGSLGDPLDRDQFRRPTAEIETLWTAPSELSGRDAANEEFVELHNPGDAPLPLDGWTLYAQHSDLGDPPVPSNAALVDFPGVTIPPEETVRIYTGGDTALDTEERFHLEESTPVLAAERVVSLTRTTEDGSETFVTVRPVDPDRLEDYPSYHLVNEVPNHWFPYLQTTTGGTHRFEFGLLLDRDALEGGFDTVPQPQGRVMDLDALIYDEEIPRGGKRVTRSYESTAWLDGTTYVWSSREVRPGVGEVSSGLRFDYLKDEHQGGPDTDEDGQNEGGG